MIARTAAFSLLFFKGRDTKSGFKVWAFNELCSLGESGRMTALAVWIFFNPQQTMVYIYAEGSGTLLGWWYGFATHTTGA
jgi:hypothetical protein